MRKVCLHYEFLQPGTLALGKKIVYSIKFKLPGAVAFEKTKLPYEID